ncbi:MAG: hypothetical protein IH945_00460 [Armatimonadetes bacterium]|nr:hypothetical protein [Armatimonadota bacterium]
MAHARIDGIIAAEAPVAVIFRRGPSKCVQMLRWDMETDEVTPGQWIKSRVYTRRCDLSPNGKYVVAAFTNYGSQHAKRAKERYGLKSWEAHGWTAVSRIPYFSAIGLWFLDSAWSGGGSWKGDTHLRINNTPYSFHEAIRTDPSVKVSKLNLGAGEDEPIWTHLLEKRGWTVESEFELRKVTRLPGQKFLEDVRKHGLKGAFKFDKMLDRTLAGLIPNYELKQAGLRTKQFENGVLRYEQWMVKTAFYGDGLRERWELVDADGVVRRRFQPERHHPQWLDIDHRGRPVFGDKGCLWAWEGFPSGEPKIIADLNKNRFEAVPPPDWALKWLPTA